MLYIGIAATVAMQELWAREVKDLDSHTDSEVTRLSAKSNANVDWNTAWLNSTESVH